MSEVEPGRLSSEIMESARILNRGSESVKAVMEKEDNRFSQALEDLQRLALAEEIPIAIVGGLAAIRYGYPAATQDIDIVVARDQLALLIQTGPKFGFKVAWQSDSGWHTITHGDVEINIVPQGGKARDSSPTTIPGPAELGVAKGLDYASLSGWIELKISSGRQKDRAHVVEVMKQTVADEIAAARVHIDSVHKDYVDIFDQLQKEAQDERQQEQGRGK